MQPWTLTHGADKKKVLFYSCEMLQEAQYEMIHQEISGGTNDLANHQIISKSLFDF